MTAPYRAQLLTNASASGPKVFWRGGVGNFTLLGNLGGATVSLEYLGPDDATMVAAGADTTLTAPGNGIAYLGACVIQAIVTGGAPTDLYAALEMVQDG